jgi:hypothetical protein
MKPDNMFANGQADSPQSVNPGQASPIHASEFGPFARRQAALRQAMLDAFSPEDVHAIVRQLIQKAREGDVSAIRLVLAYTWPAASTE